MGKLILCTGNISKTPFLFPLTSTKVYSMEELCYYIYNNIYTLSSRDFTLELMDFIEKEWNMPVTANKLKKMLHQKETLKDMVVTILCSTDYYEEQEIKDLIKTMDKLAKVNELERNKLRGDNFLKNGNYFHAAKVYNEILERVKTEKTSELFKGNVLHNMGITKLYSSSYMDAANTFEEAYQENKSRDSLLAYLFCVKLTKKDLSEQEKSQEVLLNKIEETMLEAEHLDIYQKLSEMDVLKEEGKVDIYYENLYAIIAKWKEEYKNGLV